MTAAALLLALGGGMRPGAAQTPSPLVTFLPGTQSTLLTGFVDPEGVAVDSSGNLYVTDSAPYAPPTEVYKETLSGGAYNQSVIASNFYDAWAVAVDSAGNVYVADFGAAFAGSDGAVYKLTKSGNSYTQTQIGSGFVSPDGIAVDSSGNVYVGDFGCPQCSPVVKGGAYKLTKSGNSYIQTQVGSGLDYVGGVAVDSSGNVYATEWTDYDSTNDVGIQGTLYKETYSGGSYTQSVISRSFITPGSVAVDPSGNLYVTDDNNVNGGGTVYKETLSGGTYTQSTLITGLYSPEDVAIDESGNFYLAVITSGSDDYASAGAVYKEDYADPPSLSFGSVNVGSTSSTQTVTVNNIGNAALEFEIPGSGNNPSIAPGFTLASGGSGECPLVTSESSSVGTLASGASCTLPITFAPQATGSYSGSTLVLADNNGNASPDTTQTINLSGTGTGTDKASYFVVTGAGSVTAGTATSITVTAYDATGHLVTGYSGTVHFTSSDASATLPANSTLSSGVGTFSVTLKTAGSQTVTATDTTTSSVTGLVTTTVNAAAANHLAVTAPSSVNAGTSFTLTVYAYDAYGNFASSYGGTVHFTSTDGAASLPANSTLTNGEGAFPATLRTGGSQTVTATDTSNPLITGTSSTISVTQAPAVAIAFSPTVIARNGISTLSITISNPNSATTLTGLGFTDALPTGLTVASPSNLLSTCTGTAAASGGVISLSGATLSASAACIITVSLAANNAGSFTDSVTGVTSSNGGTGQSATSTLTVVAPPSISMAFGASTVLTGNTTTLTYTIGNPNPSISLTGVSFSDALPVSLTVEGATDNCGGNAVTGASSVSLNNVSIAANTSCTLSVEVLASATGVMVNTTGVVSSTNGGSGNTASATITVDQAPSITSANSAIFTVGVSGSFTVTATGAPAPALSESGALPSGVIFNSSTGVLSGTPAAGTVGNYSIQFTASNGEGVNATQSFTLTINPPPNYVVNTTADTTTGSCTALTSTTSNTTDASCTLRAALAAAGTTGAANIYFDSTVFAAAQTITLSSAGTLTIPSNTAIHGATSGSGADLRNLVAVSGNNAYTVFTVNSGVTDASIANLTITHGNSGFGGGIINAGTLTVSDSTFSSNTASNSGGGIYNSASSTLTVTGSTFSSNSAAEYGGGIYNGTSSTLTVTSSTFYGNSTTTYDGGAINNSGAVIATNITVSGNSARRGGGIQGGSSLTLANSIVAGNSADKGVAANDEYADIGAVSFTNDGGNVASDNSSKTSTISASLAPLGNYGGPTQTMIPLPGSPAICVGLATNIPNGITTDQRGEPNTNTGYPGYNSSTPCADAGAVQTDYSIAFVQQPSAVVQNLSMSPAPSVQLDESGAAFTSGAVTVPITLTGSGTLSGGSSATSAGVATYSNLSVSATGTGDTLTAMLPLNPSLATPLSLAAASNPFNVTPSLTATQQVAAAYLTENHAISAFIPVTGSGGTGTLIYSISPALPTGLSFSPSTGSVSGTATIASPATTYTVTVTDQSNATASASFLLEVTGPPNATTAIASKGLTVNIATPPFTPVTGSGGVGTLTYSVSPTLPPGLAMNSRTGATSGLPTAISSATRYTVTVTDANGATATAGFMLAVNSPVTATDAIASKAATQNFAASFTPVTGNGGTAPLSYGISPGLPAGLSLSATTGLISGTPTVTSPGTSYTITVTDANGATATASFMLTVNPAVTATQAIASESLIYNMPASFTPVTGSGGTGALIYSVSPSLPAGLSFNTSTGAITGSPSGASSASNYVVTVTDTNGATASAGFTLTINKATATVTLANLTQTYTGLPLSATATTTPAGLAVAITYNGNSTAPTAAGSYAVVATINDTNYLGSANGTLVINKAAPALSWTTPASIVYGTALGAAQLNAAASVPGSFAYTPAAGTVLSVGPHMLSASFTPTDTSDYSSPSTATTSIMVTPAPLMVVVNNATKVYGATNPTFSGTVTGLENGDTPAIVGLAYATTATATSPVGAYAITASITSNSYTLNATPGTLTVTGAALTVTANNATKVYGTPNPAFAGTVTGAQNGDTFTESFVTTATTASPVGTYPIVPLAMGTNQADYTQSVTDGTLTVTQAASATSLQVSNTSITPGQSVTFTAQVADATAGSSGTPTGTVSFYDNGVLLNPAPAMLNAGVATYATASLAPGVAHAITATYSGDVNFTASGSTPSTSTSIAVTALDFTLSLVGPANLTVVPGQSISYQVQVSPDYGAYAGTVNFAMSGLPPGANVAFSPASIPASGGPQSVTVTIQTAAATSKLRREPTDSPGRKLEPIAFAFLVLFGAGALRKRGRVLRRMLYAWVLLGAGVATTALSGCGGHFGFLAQAPQNYTVTITATAGGLQHSATVTLNVQ